MLWVYRSTYLMQDSETSRGAWMAKSTSCFSSNPSVAQNGFLHSPLDRQEYVLAPKPWVHKIVLAIHRIVHLNYIISPL